MKELQAAKHLASLCTVTHEAELSQDAAIYCKRLVNEIVC